MRAEQEAKGEKGPAVPFKSPSDIKVNTFAAGAVEFHRKAPEGEAKDLSEEEKAGLAELYAWVNM